MKLNVSVLISLIFDLNALGPDDGPRPRPPRPPPRPRLPLASCAPLPSCGAQLRNVSRAPMGQQSRCRRDSIREEAGSVVGCAR